MENDLLVGVVYSWVCQAHGEVSIRVIIRSSSQRLCLHLAALKPSSESFRPSILLKLRSVELLYPGYHIYIYVYRSVFIWTI